MNYSRLRPSRVTWKRGMDSNHQPLRASIAASQRVTQLLYSRHLVKETALSSLGEPDSKLSMVLTTHSCPPVACPGTAILTAVSF